MAAAASSRRDGPSACLQCGAVGSTIGVMGLSVCSECGGVRSFMGDLREGRSGASSSVVPREMTGLPARPLLRVSDPGRALATCSTVSDEVSKAMRHAARVHRCRVAITRVSLAIQVQVSVIEPALNLMMRHCQRVCKNGAIPAQVKRLKCMSGACVLIASSRQGLGVTIQEVAVRTDQPLGKLQKKVWQVCMANGVRLLRNAANTNALLDRICDGLQLTVEHQRGAICAAASRLILLAEWGWIATGRHWVYIIAAAFMLAAKAYFVAIDLDTLGEVLCIPTSTILKRIEEIKRIIISLLRDLPWGHMVNTANIHAYMHFALEFFEVLAPASVELRRKRLRVQDEAEMAAKGDAVPPPSSAKTRKKWRQQHSRSQAARRSRSQDSADADAVNVSAASSSVQVAELSPHSEVKTQAAEEDTAVEVSSQPHTMKKRPNVRRRQRRAASSSSQEVRPQKRRRSLGLAPASVPLENT